MNGYRPEDHDTQRLTVTGAAQDADGVAWPPVPAWQEGTAQLPATPPVAATAPAPVWLQEGAPQVVERVVYVDRPVVVRDRAVQGTTLGWMGTLLLASVPVVGLLYVLVLACGGTAVPDRARWARAIVLWGVVSVAAAAGLLWAGALTVPDLSQSLTDLTGP